MDGDRVVEVGRGRPPGAAEDHTDAMLMPGLVNAHTHLEFSDQNEPIGSPGTPLHDWIGQVVARRGRSDPATRRDAIDAGIAESESAGVRLLAEIATPPSVAGSGDQGTSAGPNDLTGAGPSDLTGAGPSEIESPFLQVIPFAEVIGLSEIRWEERFAAAEAFLRGDDLGGWSPHAAYSTDRVAITRCVDAAVRRGRPLAMHVAESPHERTLLETGGGPFAETLRAMGVWREGSFPWGDDATRGLIEELARAPRVLLVHGNDLRDDEIATVARHRHLTVVYCPRTHARFGYPPHPVDRLLAAGIRVALGTDSRASNPDLNLWREVQRLLRHRADLAPHEVVRMATIHAADALGVPTCGRLEPGASPGLCLLKTEADDLESLWHDCARRTPRPLSTVS